MSVSMTRWPRAAGRSGQRRPSDECLPVVGQRARVAGHDDMSQIRACADHFRDRMQPLAARDEHPHVAVAQDVSDLLRLEQRIDRNEHGARDRGAERGGDGLDALVEIEGDALRAADAERKQSRRALVDRRREPGIRQRDTLLRQRGRIAVARCRVQRELVKEKGHESMDEGGIGS